MISCPADRAVTERATGGRTPVPLGAHKRSRGTGTTVTLAGQPPSVPPVASGCAWATIGSVLRWMTP